MIELTPQEFAFLSELERYDAFLRCYRSSDPADQERLRALYASPDPLLPLILLQYLEDIPEKPAVASIISLIDSPIEIVSRSAMTAYQRNHYPGKARMLKQLILSRSSRACRFAVRTLSRAAFMEIVPLVLRELPDREQDVRAEMIMSLRWLPDARVLPVLTPLAESPDESVRWMATRVLADLQPQLRQPGAPFFLRRSRDSSERVRRAALEALQRFPSRRVAPLILETALDAAAPEQVRVRAIRSLSSFPSKRWVAPLAKLASSESTAHLRLSAEVALRGFPPAILRAGLLPLVDDPASPLRRQAALFTAEFLGEDPAVRARLLAIWRACGDDAAFELVDALRILPGAEADRELAAAVLRSPLLAYGAAGALAARRGAGAGRAILGLIGAAGLDPLLIQTLLDRFAKRGPDEGIAEELFPILKTFLRSETINVRYLSTRALEWYPGEDTRAPLLDLLAAETDHQVARTAAARLAAGAGRDPRTLLAAVLAHPRRERLAAAAFRIVTSTSCLPEAADAILDAFGGPDGLLRDRPRLLAAAYVHLFEHGSAGLPRLWAAAERAGRLEAFLRLLAAAAANRKRALPPLPLAFMEARLKDAPAPMRVLHHGLLRADGRNQALKALLALLSRETDTAVRERGAAHVRAMLQESPR